MAASSSRSAIWTWFMVLGFGSQVSGFRFRVSGFGFRLQVLDVEINVKYGLRVWVLRRVEGQVLDVGLRVMCWMLGLVCST